MTASTATVEEIFDAGIAQYKAGADAAELIPTFETICQKAPKSAPAWTCLAWLYLLVGKTQSAYKAAQKAVKLNPQDPQARINLVLAMLEKGQKGVRDHIELIQHIIMVVPELRQEVTDNIQEGLTRKPDWEALLRVQAWIVG
ncbi:MULTISPECIES: M48 family metallopeptidase [Cyanophyceae]|uniref:Tetratricopeptide repeat protein n=1 Tax=Pseudocalidococcus azoricus BACA0444 TaxID=2918990 RepID=A0AAE4FS16_9CYAN|nr:MULTISPECIES: tetratricopeptide repeat protein [Cyanophyceae]AFY62423.1 tetratricopeptide repeat protein [Synechococcus sp. PCC 6312]MDS3859866.1 tetratricopeptide repeat protein [Pseudocalidococcus azoricus BACA0444]